MATRYLTALVLAVLAPAPSMAGVTLHYGGTARTESDAEAIVAGAVRFAQERGWRSDPQPRGVILHPDARSEPLELLFDGRVLAKSWVKTQFAGPETHIAIVELFRSLQQRFERLSIDDEGEYWESSDREKLIVRMQSDGLMMIRLQEENPAATGPYVLPNGRIVDLLTVGGGEARDRAAAVANLASEGVRLLSVPLVPARPWTPTVPQLAPVPSDTWQLFDSEEHRFTATFPGVPERKAHASGAVTYRANVGELLFLVYADRPVEEADAAKVLRDIPSALAKEYVGNILSDERATVFGRSVRRIGVIADGAPRHHQVVIVGNRPYTLAVIARHASPAPEDVRRFFESFRPREH